MYESEFYSRLCHNAGKTNKSTRREIQTQPRNSIFVETWLQAPVVERPLDKLCNLVGSKAVIRRSKKILSVIEATEVKVLIVVLPNLRYYGLKKGLRDDCYPEIRRYRQPYTNENTNDVVYSINHPHMNKEISGTVGNPLTVVEKVVAIVQLVILNLSDHCGVLNHGHGNEHLGRQGRLDEEDAVVKLKFIHARHLDISNKASLEYELTPSPLQKTCPRTNSVSFIFIKNWSIN
ncbi:hypothetical protein K501DRAFT_277498 [Backusella circina FSU 941]|nr:hypothetical protein K501DRAFT_277498 [Backusella circina FSU 941]